MAKTLHTNKGIAFTVNDEDHDFVSDLCWHRNKAGHITCNSRGLFFQDFLHVIIARKAWLDCSNNINHRDRNKLNNQRSNLRVATITQSAGTRRRATNNTSGFKGVSRAKTRWRAMIQFNKKQTHLGYYDTPKQAHIAYCNAAEKYFGKFAYAGE